MQRLVLLALFYLPLSAFAQNTLPHVTEQDINQFLQQQYRNDSQHFPRQTDIKALAEAAQNFSRVLSDSNELANIAASFAPDGSMFDPNREIDGQKGNYKEHPWTTGPHGLRASADSYRDWLFDSMRALGFAKGDTSTFDYEGFKNFMDCFEPRLVRPICEYCQPIIVFPDSCYQPKLNQGYVWEYWWPENEVETNDFGISALNPVALGGRGDLAPEQLTKTLDEMLTPIADAYLKTVTGDPSAAVPEEVKELTKQTANRGGYAWNQGSNLEAHLYNSYLTQSTSSMRSEGAGEWGYYHLYLYYYCLQIPFWYNGYEKGNPDRCFYDTLPPKRPVINGWTEQMPAAALWRIPTLSATVDMKLFQAAVPAHALILGSSSQEADKSYLDNNSCAAYRAKKWPDMYGDIRSTLGLGGSSSNSSELKRVCFKGGGQLYPLTGRISGTSNPLSERAILTRKALEIFSRLESSNNKCEQKKGVNRFGTDKNSNEGDSVDKLQLIYPTMDDGRAGKCFKTQQINANDNSLFPKGLLRPEHNGSVRYLHWNKRTACSCQYRGVVNPCGSSGGTQGWGCQLYPSSDQRKGAGDLLESKIEGSPPWTNMWFSIPYSDPAAKTFTKWLSGKASSGGRNSGNGGRSRSAAEPEKRQNLYSNDAE